MSVSCERKRFLLPGNAYLVAVLLPCKKLTYKKKTYFTFCLFMLFIFNDAEQIFNSIDILHNLINRLVDAKTAKIFVQFLCIDDNSVKSIRNIY